jgi:hypothetical protein
LKQSLDFVEELSKLMNLRKLGITWDSNGDDGAISKEQKLVASLCNLDRCKLHTLHIELLLTGKNAALTEHPSLSALNIIREITVGCGGQFHEIIKWMVSLVNLVKLRTHGVEIEQQDLEMVGSISTLLYLELNNKSCVRSVISSMGFQQLHTLWLNLTVRWLMFEAGAMPNLKRLCILIELDKLEYSGGGAGFDGFGLHHLSALDSVSVMFLRVDLKMASIQDSVAVDLKNMVDAHPNSPALHFGRV